jgi:hypothetical protein
MHPRARRAASVVLSIAVHVLFLLWVATVAVTIPQITQNAAMPVRIIEPRARPKAPPKPPQQVAKAQPPEAAKPVEVPPEQPPPPPEQERKIPLPEQIVSPPDAGKNEVPPDTTPQERSRQRRREAAGEARRAQAGESAPEVKPVAKPQPKKPPAPPQPQPVRKPAPPSRDTRSQTAKLPSLDRLLPNAVRLAQEGYGQPPEVVPDVAEQRPQRQLSRRQRRPLHPAGPVGSLDYLPDVREGDITLLNTKAEMFAPFVRRVALRVFQNFWISLKKDITGPIAAEEQIAAEAVMEPARRDDRLHHPQPLGAHHAGAAIGGWGRRATSASSTATRRPARNSRTATSISCSKRGSR